MIAFFSWLRAGLQWPRRNVTQRNVQGVPQVQERQKSCFVPGERVAVKDGAMPRKKWLVGQIQRVHYRDGNYRYMVGGIYYASDRLERVQP